MSILVLMLISSMIVAAIVIINPETFSLPLEPQSQRDAISLEEAMLGELSPNQFSASWILGAQNGDQLLFEESKSLNILQLSAGSTRVDQFRSNITQLVPNSSLISSIDYQGFKLSPSKRYLLIWTTKRRQFRHSFTAKYFVYDIQLDLVSKLSTQATSGQLNAYENLDSASQYLSDQLEDDGNSRFQLADWLPSNENPQRAQLDSLLLVQNNDIYLLADVTGTTDNNQLPAPKRLTFTGKENEIFNGIPDWLYEEEILADFPAVQASPTGASLAYMSFNDSQVDLMPFSIYGSNEQLIPSTRQIRYPKTGRTNPQVSVHVIDHLQDSPTDIKLSLPDKLGERQHYINRIRWLTADKLALIWVNRNQNESQFVICSRQLNWQCQLNLELRAERGWLDLFDDLQPLDEHHYLTLLFKHEDDQFGSFKHIAKVSLDEPQKFTFLTGGRKEVTNINGIDKTNSLVYFTSTPIDEPGQRQVYWTSLEASSPSVGQCLTCDHHPDECLYNYVKMSPSCEHYIFECDGPGVPRIELRSTQRRPPRISSSSSSPPADAAIKSNSPELDPIKQHDNLLWSLEDNQSLRNKLGQSKATPLTMRLKVPIANTNYTANVIMLLPPQLGSGAALKGAAKLNPSSSSSTEQVKSRRIAMSSEATPSRAFHAHFTPNSINEYTSRLVSGQQYPLVVDVYAGPGSQKVDYRFHIGFGHYLASSRRTIYVMIDGRGSGFQGTNRLYEMYHKFGTSEIEDQIEVAAYLARNFSFIDSSKMAIWGWSYGGYAAAMALAKSNSKQTSGTNQQLNSTTGGWSGSLRHIKSSNNANPSSGVFECAASVAPVTNWIYYDTAYTERYMSSPYQNEQYASSDNKLEQTSDDLRRAPKGDQRINFANKWLPLNHTSIADVQPLLPLANNLLPNTFAASSSSNSNSPTSLNDRYRKASLLDQIANIDRKRFLLIHGTADDNVHFQQSVMLMKRLIHKNVMFETRLYPDQDHSIANRADKLHLGSTLSNFFAECFDMAY